MLMLPNAWCRRRQALVAACAREASRAIILSGGADEPALAMAAIGAADILVATLRWRWKGRWSRRSMASAGVACS